MTAANDNREVRRLRAGAVARMLGRTVSWFRAHRAELEAHGFPKPLVVANTWDEKEVAAWIGMPSNCNPAPRPTLVDQYKAGKCRHG